MTHPLDGARLKVVRAKEHLKSFNEEAWRYVNTDPCKVVSKVEGDIVSVEGIVTSQPPPTLACIVGDLVTNCRAALDYIAWELAMRAGRSLSGRQLKRIMFPIATNPTDFAKPDGTAAHLRDVCAIPTPALAVIESVQPYHAGYEPLNALDQLVRVDKHRTLCLCGTFFGDMGNVSVYRGDTLAFTTYGTGSEFGMSRLKANLAASGQPPGPTPEYRVEMKGKPTVFISLKDFPSPSQTTWVGILEEISRCVDGIIPLFDSCF